MSAPPRASWPKLATSRCCWAWTQLVSSLARSASAVPASSERSEAWLRASQELRMATLSSAKAPMPLKAKPPPTVWETTRTARTVTAPTATVPRTG